MLEPVYLLQFEKEVTKSKKRGREIGKLKKVIELLVNEEPLPAKYRKHKLKGDYAGYWECHIEPDWLLIFKKTKAHVIFVRIGTHSDLF